MPRTGRPRKAITFTVSAVPMSAPEEKAFIALFDAWLTEWVEQKTKGIQYGHQPPIQKGLRNASPIEHLGAK